MWMWIGDAAYVDKHVIAEFWKSSIDVNMTKAAEIFNAAKNEEGYRKVRENVPTIGIWDDHDYAINDGNGHFEHKEIAKQLFLDFLDEPVDSQRRVHNKAIYTTYSFGDPSTHKTVRFILLDVRFNKTSMVYDTNADMLGEEQWAWFENLMETSDETFTFIVSGTQILPFNRLNTESWYGTSRKRLFDLIGRLKKSGVVLISGDIHAAQFLKTFCVIPEVGYNLFELTSSGLSHFDEDYFVMEYIFPIDYNIIPTISYYNFGVLSFEWGLTKEDSKFKVTIIDIDDITRAEMSIKYNDLTYNKSRITDPNCYDKINRRYKTLEEYYEYYSKNRFEFFATCAIYYALYQAVKFIIWLIAFLLRISIRFIFSDNYSGGKSKMD